MMTCESCCREFKATIHSRDCPHCGFNNGKGWWPRLECAPIPNRHARPKPFGARRKKESCGVQHA